MLYPKCKIQNLKFHLLLLLLWLAIGAGLRFTHLELKSPWTDEFSTLVFSLGNSYRTVPLDRAIALDALLQPLQTNPNVGAREVVQHLLSESNHPPLYFVLAHWWMQMFPTDGGLVSLWGARSLPAFLGTASIPAMFGLGWLAFRSRLVGHLAAALMAVSPYGIFLAQEARHYTLAILWVIASLCCLVVAVRCIQRRTPLPISIAFSWVAVNSLGIATHYFFALTLCAEAIVLIGLGMGYGALGMGKPNFPNLKSLIAVAAGTLAGGLVWLPLLQNGYDSELTEWIMNSDRTGWEWVAPIFQAIAAWLTMLSLLPVEASELPIVIASGLVMVIFFLWALPIVRRGLQVRMQQLDSRINIQVLGGFVLGAIAIFFIITYGFGIDLTRGARYNFVYFPAVIVLVGASLAVVWVEARTPSPTVERRELEKNALLNFLRITGKISVVVIWIMGLLSGLTVVWNLGYQKYYRPDLLVPIIQQTSDVPVLIATTHQTHVQTGELMGLAWEFRRQASKDLSATTQFLLAHQDRKESRMATITLQKTLNKMSRPLNLWLVNFHSPVDLKAQNCLSKSPSLPAVDGYNYQMYQCD